MTMKIRSRKGKLLFAIAMVLLVWVCGCFFRQDRRKPITAAADSAVIEVQKFDVTMDVRTDRKTEITERITVKFLTSGLTMFYRSLPKTGAIYRDITASCAGNDAFSYNVKSNPDTDEFLDVNCVGGAEKGNVWTYEISYTMQDVSNAFDDGMVLDTVGFGWSVPLKDVTVIVNFPEDISAENYEVYIGEYGTENKREPNSVTVSARQIQIRQAELPLVYNETYHEWMAAGITVEFSYPSGVMDGYLKTQLLTDDMWKIALGGVICATLAFLLRRLTKKDYEMITVVNIKAPDGLDPLQMGKYLDGTADDEDVTSMIFYFADQGYLQINFEDEKDPELISCVPSLPDGAPTHQKILFNGLFASARTLQSEKPFEEAAAWSRKAVKISELQGKFFDEAKTAGKCAPTPKPMYERRSVLGFVGGCVLAILFALLVPLLQGLSLGGGYLYAFGIVYAIPVVAIAVIAWCKENYRYKWTKKKQFAFLALEIGIAAIASLLFVLLAANYVMTSFEKLVMSAFTFLICGLTHSALSRTKNYVDGLGQILGFKDFILYTEEDKIKVMLEENPELYYDVLPYAQVLGITKEWSDKFKKLTVAPPSWGVGFNDLTLFDYWILHRCMRVALANVWRSARLANMQKVGGTFVGRSGGGGGFGGFGGGGIGGGGGGAR